MPPPSSPGLGTSTTYLINAHTPLPPGPSNTSPVTYRTNQSPPGPPSPLPSPSPLFSRGPSIIRYGVSIHLLKCYRYRCRIESSDLPSNVLLIIFFIFISCLFFILFFSPSLLLLTSLTLGSTRLEDGLSSRLPYRVPLPPTQPIPPIPPIPLSELHLRGASATPRRISLSLSFCLCLPVSCLLSLARALACSGRTPAIIVSCCLTEAWFQLPLSSKPRRWQG